MKPPRSPAYLKKVRTWPCIICSAPSSEAAHVKGSWVGIGLPKPGDDRALPLCSWCHRNWNEAQHSHNETEWWAAMGADPLELAGKLHACWVADKRDAQGIDEIIGMAHHAIKQYARRAYGHAAADFLESPSLERADAVQRAHKIHLVAHGASQNYDRLVTTLSEQITAILIKTEAA